MKSREFRSRLADAARLTVKTGYEAGFQIYAPISITHLYWAPVIRGSSDLVDFQPEGALIEWADAMGVDLNTCAVALSVHTHPHSHSLSLDLSEDDLGAVVLGRPDVDLRPVIGIATIGDDRRGALLLMRSLCNLQGPRPELYEALLERYQAYEGPWPSDALAEALTIPQHVASVVIRYSIPRRPGPASLQLGHPFRAFCYLGEPNDRHT